MTLGDRCKALEDQEAMRKALPGLPIIARLDGRAFHTFTRGLKRPYDQRMSNLMIATTSFLVDELDARIGYTQSDEISLFWYVTDPKSELPFGGRFQKLCSVLAGLASAKFTKGIEFNIPEKEIARNGELETDYTVACFDCRVWQVPTIQDVIDVFVWREDDATKNSISMAADSVYSHKELLNKNSSDKQEMLWQKGINWNDYPDFFKRGTYVRRKTEERTLTTEELSRIPESHRPHADTTFMRSSVVTLNMPPIRKVTNLIDVLVNSAEPEVA